MDSAEFLASHPASEVRLVGSITNMCGSFAVHVDTVAPEGKAVETLSFISSGPFMTEDEAKAEAVEFANTSGYELTWISPAKWM